MIDFKYWTLFISFFFVNVLIMKVLSLRVAGPTNATAVSNFLFKTPVLTLRTMRLSRPVTTEVMAKLVMRSVLVSVLVMGMYQGYTYLFTHYQFPTIGKSYLLIFFIYAMTLYIYSMAQILCMPTGKIPVDMHDHPLVSKNLREFWGKRWNVWVRDWLGALSSAVVKGRNHQKKIFFSFLFSGLFHEIMFQVPYGIYTGNWVLGQMTVYFMLQCAMVLVDSRLKPIASDGVRCFLMWVTLVVPSPLFINEALLYFLGF